MHIKPKFKAIQRHKLLLFSIVFSIIIILIIKIIPMIVLAYGDENVIYKLNQDKNNGETEINIFEYGLTDLIKYMSIEDTEIITFNANSNLPYVINNEKYVVTVKQSNKSENSTYSIVYGINNEFTEENFEDSKEIEFEFETEGANECYIAVKKDGEILKDAEWSKTTYKIDSYQKQFLDELETKGVGVHILATSPEDFYPIYNALGAQYIRIDLSLANIYTGEEYDFSKYNNVLKPLLEKNVQVLGILGAPGTIFGDDKKISSNEELELFKKIINEIQEEYPEITDYEIWNEPNNLYKEDEEIEWYAKIVNIASATLKEKNNNIKILSGGTSYGSNAIYPTEYIEKVSKHSIYKNLDLIASHVYDFGRKDILNKTFEERLNENKNVVNELGGFLYNSNTEFGGSTYDGFLSEEEQSMKIIQQYVLGDKYNNEYLMVYNFRNSGSDIENSEDNFGLVDIDYNPKKSYYVLKNYYENINGAQYIGPVNIANGLEAHVYDKDGKPKIIAWSNNSENNIVIPYQDFIAKDIYGNDIENTEGTLTITTSPVYLDNISTNYFYQAISNVALEKYAEFEEKFSTEIASVNGLTEKINELKQYITGIANLEIENEETAKQKMQEHFELGNLILSAYQNNQLEAEYVKISSMLDMLNDIGNSYEDLVTVSTKNINSNLETTKELIESTEQKINNNADLDILYPEKILEFSKDLFEKSDYINRLEEDNGIKIGLLESYNLHAYYLANWANSFNNIGIEKYIANNPITENYSITELTNQDVTVTLNIGEDTKITNNSGSNIYTFTENNSFTFEYERRGTQGEITTTVDWIDKQAPIIEGIENKKVYTEPIQIMVSDENIDTITLTKDGQTVEFTNGQTITEDGTYTITAKDKATNETSYNFTYVDLEIPDYEIKDDGYIINIEPNTTAEQFLNKIETSSNIVLENNEIQLATKEKIKTGTVVKIDNNPIYTIVVTGDITGDGNVDIADLVQLNMHSIGKMDLENEYLLAGDINHDGNVDIGDLVLLNLYSIGKLNTL